MDNFNSEEYDERRSYIATDKIIRKYGGFTLKVAELFEKNNYIATAKYIYESMINNYCEKDAIINLARIYQDGEDFYQSFHLLQWACGLNAFHTNPTYDWDADVGLIQYPAIQQTRYTTSQGSHEAINALADMYRLGLGMDANVVKAFDLYISAAEKGNTKAMINIGMLYEHEYKKEFEEEEYRYKDNVKGDFDDYTNIDKVEYWYKKAVKLGNNDACMNLTSLYYSNGYYVDAIRYLNKGIMCNNASTIYLFVEMYETGLYGIEQNISVDTGKIIFRAIQYDIKKIQENFQNNDFIHFILQENHDLQCNNDHLFNYIDYLKNGGSDENNLSHDHNMHPENSIVKHLIYRAIKRDVVYNNIKRIREKFHLDDFTIVTLLKNYELQCEYDQSVNHIDYLKNGVSDEDYHTF